MHLGFKCIIASCSQSHVPPGDALRGSEFGWFGFIPHGGCRFYMGEALEPPQLLWTSWASSWRRTEVEKPSWGQPSPRTRTLQPPTLLLLKVCPLVTYRPAESLGAAEIHSLLRIPAFWRQSKGSAGGTDCLFWCNCSEMSCSVWDSCQSFFFSPFFLSFSFFLEISSFI